MTREMTPGGVVAPAIGLSSGPDWALIRRDYERTTETVEVLARRHGVKPGQIKSRRARDRWWRPGDRQIKPKLAPDDLATMAQTIQRYTKKLIRRDGRLTARLIARCGSLDEDVAQHRQCIGSLGALLKMVQTLRKVQLALPPAAEDKEEQRRNARHEVESRLARIAAAFQAAGCPAEPE